MEMCQLINFYCVARNKTLTKAAEELHMTQPALSKSISSFEQELGVKLFYRDGRKLQLNKYGKVVNEHLVRFFNTLDDGKLHLNEFYDGNLTELHIASSSCPQNSGPLRLVIDKFMRDNPNIGLNHKVYAQGLLPRMLEQREVDIAITSGDIQNGNIAWYPLYKEYGGIIMSKECALAKIPVLRVRDLSMQPFIIRYANSEELSRLEAICHSAGFKPYIHLLSADENFAMERVARNEGIAFAELPFGRELEHHNEIIPIDNELVFRKIADSDCSYQIGYAVLKNRYYTKALREFISCLEIYQAP